MAYTSNSSLCLSQSPSLGLWVFDSHITNHISSNHYLFSSFTTTDNLPFIIVANGSQAQAHDIIQPVSSLNTEFFSLGPKWPF